MGFITHGAASLSGSTPFLVNVSAATSGTEYSYALPDNTLQFSLKSRSSGKLYIAYANGTTGTNYYTVYPGDTYVIQGVTLTSVTIYFQSTKNNDVIEVQGFSA